MAPSLSSSSQGCLGKSGVYVESHETRTMLPPSTPPTTPSTPRSSPYLDSQVGRREPVQSSIKEAATSPKDEGSRPRTHHSSITQNGIRSLIVIGPALNDMASLFSPILHFKHIILVPWCNDSKEILVCSPALARIQHGRRRPCVGRWAVEGCLAVIAHTAVSRNLT